MKFEDLIGKQVILTTIDGSMRSGVIDRIEYQEIGLAGGEPFRVPVTLLFPGDIDDGVELRILSEVKVDEPEPVVDDEDARETAVDDLFIVDGDE